MGLWVANHMTKIRYSVKDNSHNFKNICTKKCLRCNVMTGR